MQGAALLVIGYLLYSRYRAAKVEEAKAYPGDLLQGVLGGLRDALSPFLPGGSPAPAPTPPAAGDGGSTTGGLLDGINRGIHDTLSPFTTEADEDPADPEEGA